MIFHDHTQINEIKQAALFAYWILKFRPFMINTDDPDRSYKFRRINEGFAAFYLLSAAKQFAQKREHRILKMSDRLTSEIMYAFTYWDLSKEAAILIAETVAEAFFGIQAQGMDECE